MTTIVDPLPAQPPTEPSHVQKYPPPPPETSAERKGRLIALFVMPFLMVTMMYATYMGTMHDPQPRDLPVAVVGEGDSARHFAADLEQDSDGALAVRLLDDMAVAKELAQDQDVVGVIELPAGADNKAVVSHVMAGGAAQASLVDELLTPSALARGWEVESVDLQALPAGDGTGTMVLFATLGMMLAGYVPLSGMLAGTPNLLRVRKFVPALLGWSVAISTLLWLILGPMIGAVEGHFALFLGVGTLTVAAVGISQLLMTQLIGPFSVLLGMLVWVVFGVPASNMTMSIHTMPGFFQWLHDVLPLPAAGELLRSVVYFDGKGAGAHLLTLALWFVIPLILAILKERRSGHVVVGGPRYTERDAPLSALAGGPVAPYRNRVVAAILFPLSIVLTVVVLMSLSMHQPDIHGLPVAVVAPTSAAADEFVEAVEPQLGEYVDLQVAASDEVNDLIRSQDLVAAYVLPSAAGQAPTLISAGGAGSSQQTIVTRLFGGVAAASGAELVLDDIAPLADTDTNGTNSLYVGMSWIMAGFLFFAMFRGGAPDLKRTRDLLPMVAGWSVGISIWLWFLFDVIIGAVNGHALALIGAGSLTVFGVAWASAVVIRTVGLGGLAPVITVVMLAGVPASGGGLSIYMVPDFFRPLAEVLPLPAAVDIVRSVVYLDGVGIWGDVLVLALWAVIGLALNLLVVDRWVNRDGARPHAPMGPRHASERKPKKVEPEPEPELVNV